MIIELSKCKVHLKDELTWYQMQEIQSELASGAKFAGTGLSGFDGMAMLKAKVRLMSTIVEKIEVGDKTQRFSEEWLRSLSVADGNKLDKEVGAIAKKNQ